MHKARLRKVGGSVMIAVPPALLEMLDLAPNDPVGLTVEAGRLVVEPARRPKYTLSELLAQCDAQAPRPKGDEAWLGTRPVGDEVI